MSSNAPKPRLVLNLKAYLWQRKKEYKTLYKAWLAGTDAFRYAPATWPADRCLLTTLPAELLLLVCKPLYQADLFHLALTCHALAALALPLLYKRDIADFDCVGLRWACTLGIVPTLERCLGYGASPNHVFDAHSHTKCSWLLGSDAPWTWFCRDPLRTAIVASEPEIVRLLLAHGADVHAPDPKLVGLGRNLNYEVLHPINFAMGTPDMAVFPTFQPGHTAIVRHLLHAGADPNSHPQHQPAFYVPPRMRTSAPLVMAMRPAVPVETVRLLLENGADPTRIGSFQHPFFPHPSWFPDQLWGRSPLGVTLLKCYGRSALSPLDLEKFRLLLAYGGAHELVCFYAGPSRRYPMPLLYRHWDHPQAVDALKLFIAEGADMASWAETAIPATFSVIWSAQDDMSRPTSWAFPDNNASSKRRAATRKVCEVITLIAEATLLEDSTRGVRKSSLIDAMVPADLEALCRKSKGQTALRYVCRPLGIEGATDIIAVLLRYGADMNSADRRGRTALHHASAFGSHERVAELVQFLGGPASSGLIVDALDARGWTPLHYACLFGFWGQAGDQVARAVLLLRNGANVRARTNNGWTPLSLAVFCANHDLVSLLLDHGADVSDLFLLRGNDIEPSMAPIGRIVFFCWTVRYDLDRWEPGLASGLTASKKVVAGILEHRLGIPVSLPPPLDAALVSPKYAPGNERSLLNGGFAHRHVDVVDYPFAMPRQPFRDLSSQKIERNIESILAVLDSLGLEAWIAPLSDDRQRAINWRGYPSDFPDDV